MRPPHSHRSGFTLVELLTVIAVIGILGAIIIPTVSSVRTSARKASTRAFFSQVISGIEQFKTEYRYFPDLSSGTSQNPDNLKLNEGLDWLLHAMAGRRLDGTTDATRLREAGNIRSIQFLNIPDNHIDRTSGRVIDSFGNSDIVLVMDVDRTDVTNDPGYDGLIKVPNFSVQAGLNPAGPNLRTAEGLLDANDVQRRIRTNVLLYSPGAGNDDTDIVKSWSN